CVKFFLRCDPSPGGLVSVEYEYQYKAKDGHIISIKPQEVYILVCKTNEHWWRVRKDQDTKPFYIPASYVKELSAPPTKSTPTKNSSESDTKSKPLICTSQAPSKEKYRFSTFGFLVHWTFTSGLWVGPSKPAHISHHPFIRPGVPKSRPQGPASFWFYRNLVVSSANYLDQVCLTNKELQWQVGRRTCRTVAFEWKLEICLITLLIFFLSLQVQDDNVRTGVYVNVAQLRQSISESPPSVASPCSPSPFNEWEVHVDQDSGQEYYYHTATGRTTWESPFLDSPTDTQQLPSEEPRPPSLPRSPLSLSSPLPSGWTSDWEQLWIKSVDEQGQTYYYLRDGSRSQPNLNSSPPIVGLCLPSHNALLPLEVTDLKISGILNKTKVCENGKKVRKNWTATWTVLREGVLTFHKDPKSTTGTCWQRQSQIVPEFAVELKGATIGWASKDKSSKKNVLEVQSKPAVTNSPSSSGETDPKKVRTKLMKLLMKRPTLEAVKEKGYFRENVFGCPLDTLCAHEKTTVPSFVEKCIKAVEKRGLDIDGLYRVSGNLAVIQKLRFKADHEELNLEDGQWEDVHVITGALKLFFRELPEPLFPYSHFEAFISAIRIPDYNTKLLRIYELVRSLPQANHDTMALLFEHLHRLIQYGEDNRMTVQNVAIVFGPTLLRPEKESSNIAMHMIFQNQIVEFILNEYERIFCSS
uniref:Rho GTPase activating protein 27 n=1 Tax=Oryzias melastigma TaxID=30732 RepID=A0A3B3BHZ7_ORYME